MDRIWSYSRVSKFEACKWDYVATYLWHMELSKGNIYSFMGSQFHQEMEDFYNHEIGYDDLYKQWSKFVAKWESDPARYMFDTVKIKDGYIKNLNHYFKHTKVMTDKAVNEKPVRAIVKSDKGNKYVFVGYVDTEYTDEDGNLVLVDYKTSSKSSFSKAKLPEKSMQLRLYAMAEHQVHGTPYDKIKARFDMAKYCTVHFKQENGKWKTSVQERYQWVEKMRKKLETKLKKTDLDPIAIEEMIDTACANNDMDNLPEDIREQFYIENYFIEIDINEDDMKELNKHIGNKCDEIVALEDIEDLEGYLSYTYPYDPDNYYDKKLCAYHTSDYFKKRENLVDDLPPEENLDEDTAWLFGGEMDKQQDDETDEIMNMLFG